MGIIGKIGESDVAASSKSTETSMLVHVSDT